MFPVGRQPPSGSPKLHRAPLYAHHPARRRSRWLLIGLALLGLAFWYWRTGSPKELQNAKDGEDSNLDDFDSRIDNEFNSKDARDGSGKEAADERGGIDGVDQANADSLDSLITKRNSNANWFPVGDVSKLPDPLAGFTSAYTAYLHSLLMHRTTRAYPRFIALLYVDDGDRDMILNWLCHARIIGFKTFIIVTRDEKLFWWLRYRAGESAVYLELPEGKERSTDQMLAPPSGARAAYNSPSFKSHMLYRTSFVLTLLERGWNVLIADADAVWFDDPRPYLWKGVKQGAGIIAQDDVTMLCGGFMLLISNEKVVELWREVTRLFNIDHVRTNEQLILKRLLESGKHDVKVHKLPQNLFPSGKHWFDRGGWKAVRENGWPIVVHNNFVRTKADKLARFSTFHFWRVVSVDDGKCAEVLLPSYEATVAPNIGKWRLTVKVLASTVQEAETVLSALEATDYNGAKVDVTILVPDEQAAQLGQLLASSYSHGQLRASVGTARRPAGVWVPDGGETGRTLAVIVSPKATLSPSWFRSINTLLARYAGDDHKEFDPRVFGFGFGLHDNYHLPSQTGAYRYQSFPPLVALFPWHWSQFLQADPMFDPDLAETFGRWMAVHGYYCIYAPTEVGPADSLPSLAKLTTYDYYGNAARASESLVARSWYFEMDRPTAEGTVERTAVQKPGSESGSKDVEHRRSKTNVHDKGKKRRKD